MASIIGSLRVVLGLDSAEYTQGLSRAEAQSAKFEASQKRTLASIDRQVKALQTQAAQLGMSAREIRLSELAHKGATAAQLASADAALRQAEAFKAAEDRAAAFRSVGVAVGAAAAAAAAGLVAMAKGAIDAADNLRDASQKTGIAAVDLGGIGYAAEQAGSSLESIVPALGKFNKSIAAAASGNKEAIAPFKAIGVAVLDSAGKAKKADALLAEFADRFREYEDGPEKAALAVAAFGKAGAELIPLLNDGGVKLKENIGYFREHSGVTEELTAQADEFNDTLTKVKLIVSALGNSMASDLLPILQAVAEEILKTDSAASKLGSSGGILKTVLDTIVVTGANVAYVLKATGKEIGGIAAQIGALLSLDFSGFSAISDAMREDARRARIEIDSFSEKVLNPQAYADIADESKRMAARARASAGEALPTEVEPGKKRAPKLPDEGAASRAAADLRKRLDGQVQAVKDFARDQAEMYDFANRLAEGRYSAGLVSLEEFYSEQKTLRDAALAAQLRAIDQQRALQEAAIPKLKGADRIEAENKIADAARERARVVEKARQTELLAEQAQQAAILQTRQRYDDLRATIAELSGDAAAASRLRIDAQVKEAERIAKAAGADPTTTGSIYRTRLEDTERLRVAQEQYTRLLERTRVAEEEIMLAAEKAGASEFGVLIQVGEARARALEEMKALTDQSVELALALGTPEAIRFAEQLTLGLKRASAEVDPLLQKMKDLGAEAGQSIASGLESALTSGASLRDVLKGIYNDLIKIATRELITKPLGAAISGAISGGTSGGTSGGAGGANVFSSIIGLIGAAFGAGGGKALGGPVMPGSLHEVAENRPEMLDVGGKKFLLMGNQRGNIDPNPRLSGGGGASVNANIVVQMPQGTTQQTMTQAGGAVARQIAAAARRVN